MLAWMIYISFLGALALLFLPDRFAAWSRAFALLTTVVTLGIAVAAFVMQRSGEMLPVTNVRWISSMGIGFDLRADGISLTLLLLTGVIGVCGILFSWNIEHRAGEFFALYLLLIGAMYGVFLSYDLFLFFVFYEIVVIPKYFLIAIWGSTRREYAAMKLVLYSFVGSAMVLIGLIAAYVAAGSRSMGLGYLGGFPFSPHFQMWAFPLVFAGFAVLAGMWPFHTWAPTGHVAAPTATSMLLAGVVMKLGAYGCLRVAMTLFPLGMAPWGFHVLGLGSWRDVFALLALIGILYGALVALVQKDFKFVIGYSSISHMGFILLGLMTLNQIGVSGAVIQMVSHSILAGLLFAVVGRMVYARTHTRDLTALGKMHLSKALPFAAVTFVIAGMAAMGLPGFSGFVAELMILIGVWHSYPTFVIFVAIGLIVGVAYIWRAMQQAFFAGAGPKTEPPAHLPETSVPLSETQAHPMEPISVPERIAAVFLIAASVVVGIFPQIFLNIIRPALESPLFNGLRQGGW